MGRPPVNKAAARGGSAHQIDLLGVSMGMYRDASPLYKFGHNEDVGTAWETLWSSGGLLPYLTVAATLSVSSSDAADNGASSPLGTGARTVDLIGLDASYNQITETVTLTGTTPVVTTNSFLRLYRVQCQLVGSGGDNAGVITVDDGASPAVVYATVEATHGQTLMAAYTVPAGYTAYLLVYHIYSDSAQEVESMLIMRETGKSWRVQDHVHLYRNNAQVDFFAPTEYLEKTDIELRTKAAGAGGNCTGSMNLVLVRN